MKRKIQTFSVSKGGRTLRYYDPTTPDNRKRAASEFVGLLTWKEQKIRDEYDQQQRLLMLLALMVLAFGMFVLPILIGGE
jgi:hypothetical protein